jgi:hypothetical protein
MIKSLPRTMALIGALSTLSLVAFEAQAADVRVRCEVRSDRSRGSVDGNNLARGNYYAVFSSGANSAQSPVEASQGDEAEFDFDSNPRDIRQGATPIAKNFIVNNQATGSIYTEAGTLVATKTVNCRRK